MRYHAAWLVDCKAPPEQQLFISQYRPGKPVILVRRYGKGLMAVIGDTCFAMNKNLERRDGLPIEGKRENADFWRWFLSLLEEGDRWNPPPAKKDTEDDSSDDTADKTEVEPGDVPDGGDEDGGNDEGVSIFKEFDRLKRVGLGNAHADENDADFNPEETP